MSREKGDTLVRSPPSVMNVEMYGSPHIGGSSGGWVDQTPHNARVTKISPTSNSLKGHEEYNRKHGRNRRNKHSFIEVCLYFLLFTHTFLSASFWKTNK